MNVKLPVMIADLLFTLVHGGLKSHTIMWSDPTIMGVYLTKSIQNNKKQRKKKQKSKH